MKNYVLEQPAGMNLSFQPVAVFFLTTHVQVPSTERFHAIVAPAISLLAFLPKVPTIFTVVLSLSVKSILDNKLERGAFEVASAPVP